MDFAKAIETAQKAPDSTYVPYDPFTGVAKKEPALVSDVVTPEKIPGSPRLNLEFFSKRFFIGRELVAINQNEKMFEERDDSADFKVVMDKVLLGEAMIIARKDAILGDGGVVIWLEWGEKPPALVREARAHLNEQELRSPERLTERSQKEDAEASEPEPRSYLDDGESHEDEPDW